MSVFIGLGSNLDNPVEQINNARQALATIDSINEIAFSSLYRSAPMGPQDQPDYVNAVLAITTSLSAHQLLAELQNIEQQQGRQRNGERWGARTLDLDLLLFDDQQINTAELIVPHVGLRERAFVLYPLAEIVNPDKLLIPGIGPLATVLKQCPKNGLERIE